MRTLAAALLLAVLPAAANAAGCPVQKPRVIGATQGYVQELGDLCLVSIDPAFTADLVYRSYAVFADGLLLVFNSYGAGDDIGRLTGAREFRFFPRSSSIGLAMDEASGTISVTMANGDTLSVDPATGQLSGSRNGQLSVDPSISPTNGGGVEFPAYRGLVLDLGFARGHSPSDRPDGRATFRDAAGQTCSVSNQEIFKYTPDGEHSFKFGDTQLVNWLHFRCPFLSPGFSPDRDSPLPAPKPFAPLRVPTAL